MRKIKRWRYYCDFCKKAGGSAFHMRNHEQGCTANPDRVCGMCKTGELAQKPMAELLAAIGDNGEESLKRLRTITEGCPACILAAIRISKTNEHDEDEDGMSAYNSYIVYDFKKEHDEFWAEYRENQPDYYGH